MMPSGNSLPAGSILECSVSASDGRSDECELYCYPGFQLVVAMSGSGSIGAGCGYGTEGGPSLGVGASCSTNGGTCTASSEVIPAPALAKCRIDANEDESATGRCFVVPALINEN